ncbi:MULTISPECIES: hypothetical protein [unclassified Streptomyces]|uniref:hypothetical protein n=1 Tax=unclassified Streptomyces TaxID=2593676 RepID=UPI00368D3F9B
MRPQAPLRLTVLAASAALTLGAAGPAVADTHQPPPVTTVAAPAPAGDTPAEAAGTGSFKEAVNSAVAELLATIKADGKLSDAATEAFDAKIAKAVAAARETAMAALPEAPAPSTPAQAAPSAPAPVQAAPAAPAPVQAAPSAPDAVGLLDLPALLGALLGPVAQAAPAPSAAPAAPVR